MTRSSQQSVQEKAESDYVHGHSQKEIQRLVQQAALLSPITERLMRSVKIAPGMRVLDLGCGAGDVAMLAAEFVGETGTVVGIDWNQEVLAAATERVREYGLHQVHFERAMVESFFCEEGFDLVIGRYVLIHQSDPVRFLRAAANLVKPGGTIAFHEARVNQGFDSLPLVPLWRIIGDLLVTALVSAQPQRDVSDRLVECFAEAGLPQPALFSETIIGAGPDSPLYGWAAETLRSVLPQLTKAGIFLNESVGIETLERNLREAVVAARSQIVMPAQICAWASV